MNIIIVVVAKDLQLYIGDIKPPVNISCYKTINLHL